MKEKVASLQTEFEGELAKAEALSDVEKLQVKYLGKKGPIQELMKALKDVDSVDRPGAGKIINELKFTITRQIEELKHELLLKEEQERLGQETIDISLPGRQQFPARKHLITHVLDQIIDILSGMGFTVQYGPDIESDYYNFEALNFPPEHPARDLQDTFYIDKNMLLRTHTSNIQARVMEVTEPPIRIISPGKCYRNEAVSARSNVFFHQVEALYIDKGVSFSDLLATLDEFLKKLYGDDVRTQYRPSYFPFVEPGMEVDIHCNMCDGAGCAICKHTGWLEVAGAGMVHPEVLKAGGIDPEEYTGYAFGMGIERLVMMRHGIRDIRLFSENDLRFLNQFSAI